MMVDKIALDCPECNETLELDPGFAGGICRCFSCGTLMTVPLDPRKGKAESLSRPDRPDAPGGGMARPGATSAAAIPSPSMGQPSSARPNTPVQRKISTPSSVGDIASSPQFYLTASGQKVQVGAGQLIPLARKKKRPFIRTAIAVVCVGLLVWLVAVWVLAARTSLDSAAGSRASVSAAGVAGSNPFLINQPNFLGQRLGKFTVIAIDASACGRPWLSIAKDALMILSDKAPNTALQIVFWTDAGPQAFPDHPRPLVAADKLQLQDFLRGIPASGAAEPTPAVELALKHSLEQLILVTSQNLTMRQVDAVDLRLEPHPEVRLDAIVIGAHLPRLQTLVARQQGSYVSPSVAQLRQWHGAAFPAAPK